MKIEDRGGKAWLCCLLADGFLGLLGKLGFFASVLPHDICLAAIHSADIEFLLSTILYNKHHYTSGSW